MIEIYPFFVWQQLPSSLIQHIISPLHTGIFTANEAKIKSLRLAEGCQGHYAMGNYIYLYWLIDPKNGFIIDAKFQAFGSPILIGIGNFLCETMIGKSYAEGKKINFEALKKQFNISNEILKSSQIRPYLNLCLDALDDIIAQCYDLPCDSSISFQNNTTFEFENVDPLTKSEWNNLSKQDRLDLIRKTFTTHIENFLYLDGGGAVIESIDDDNVISIRYSGACSGCFSAVGSTLSSIEQILQNYVFHEIKVKVNEDSLNFNFFNEM